MKEDRITNDEFFSVKNFPLFNSFTFVKGIGEKIETTLKGLGIKSWHDVMKNQCPELFPERRWHNLLNGVSSALQALKVLDVPRLSNLIPKRQHWKMIQTLLTESPIWILKRRV